LKAYYPVCGYPQADDWIFASDYNFGKTPLWPDSLRTKMLQPAARRAGITGEKFGWAYFPAYLQLVAGRNRRRRKGGAGADAPCQDQHDDGVYAQAGMEKKRVAQSMRC
jgi:hypothetical protein